MEDDDDGGDFKVKVIHDILHDLVLPKVSYPENFELIYLLYVCQELEGQVVIGVLWMTLIVPDQRHGGYESTLSFQLFLTLESQPVCQIPAF